MEYRPGLEGVVAAETEISCLDTGQEQVVVRGYDLLELARKRSYPDVAGLLLDGRLPSPSERARIEAELLAGARTVPGPVWGVLARLPREGHPMDALRTTVSALGLWGEPQHPYRLIGQVAALVANLIRVREGEAPRLPEGDGGFAGAFLGMVTGRAHSPDEVRAFDQTLVAYSEHELPNSTFAARVIASTLADTHGALTGAAASLKGPLHGGANEAVMHMLLEGGDEAGLERLIRERLARGERIMGFGHRVYMGRMDPRAQLVKETLARLVARKAEGERLLRMCERGEEVMRREKGLYPNLDYYAAPVYYLLGILVGLYTPIFFVARSAGLLAHIREQQARNRLFRPRVLYRGPRGLRVD